MVQDLADLAADGHAGDGADGLAVMPVGQPDLAAHIVGVKIRLDAGHGDDLQIGTGLLLCGAGVQLQDGQASGGLRIHILGEAVGTVAGHGLATVYDAFFTEGQTVIVEAPAVGTAGNARYHGNTQKITLGRGLEGIAHIVDIVVAVDGGEIQVVGEIPEQLHELLGIEDDLGGAGDLHALCFKPGLGLGQLVRDLTAQLFQVQGTEIHLLVELHAFAVLGGGGDGFDHGGPADLRLVQTTAVGHGVRDAVDEDLHCVQAGDIQGIGIKDRVCDLGGQLGCVPGIEIGGHGKFALLPGGEGVGGIVDELCLGGGIVDELVQLRLGGGGVDEELTVAPEVAVIHIDRDFLVGIVRIADRLQGALDEEQLVALPAGNVDFPVADFFMGL